MSPLRQALADYLAVRRALGYKLARPEKLLGQFITYLEEAGAATVTTGHALAWAIAARRRRQLACAAAVSGPRVRHLPAHPRPGRPRCRPRT